MGSSKSRIQKDQMKKITFGNVTFKNISQINKEIIEKSKERQATLKNNKWYIRDGDYQKYNWKEMFLNISECSTQSLNLRNNDMVQIISQIQYVRYPNLKELYLGGNKINNIQSLSSIHFNYLQVLGLGQNQISQINCMKKLSTPSLNWISLNSNPFVQISALTKTKINQKLFEFLLLQIYYKADPINQDLSVIVKLSTQQVKKLCVKSNKRINQVQILSMLKLRFPSINIQKQKQKQNEIAKLK